MKTDPFAQTEFSSVKQQLLEDGRPEDIVVQALKECQAAIDAGKSIDREAILAKYPTIRDELSACLEGLELLRPVREMDATTPSGNNSRTAVGQSLSPSATLGDFRIERELGRGGMGVVYEAEQLSVGRKVALKVLPYAAMLDNRQVARFQNEARAAATLEHPHIVPVYFVGNERGVYYYAMRLIDGKNLAEVMVELLSSSDQAANSLPFSQAASRLLERQPSFGSEQDSQSSSVPETMRDAAVEVSTSLGSSLGTGTKFYFESIARLGCQVAEALDFAHSHGIVHRDVKPANIMLDEVGDAWITDFGLARIEADRGMTITGDLVGTLRYMSPEQTLAKRITVDHRSDVYSLGATLYELLTLRAMFEGDRGTLLHQIANVEPMTPRMLVPTIPKDLETIILKALRKSPEDRYQTAHDLADDLGRFLANQPVLARRTPLSQRFRMWTRRHPTVVAAVTVMSALLLLSAAVIGFLVAKYEHEERAQQAAATAEAESALKRINSSLKVAAEQRNRADTAAKEAIHLRSLAETRSDRLREQLYVQEMRQAFDAWNNGWTDQVEELLEQQTPDESQRDYRGFEWYALKALTWRPPAIELVGHDGPVNALALLPDRRRLASVGEDGTVRIWNLESNQEEYSLQVSRTLTQRTLDLQGVLSGLVNGSSLARFRETQDLHALAISPDGKQLATGNQALRLWDLEGRSLIRELAIFPTRIFGVAFSSDGNLVAAHSADEGMKVVNVNGNIVNSAQTGLGRYRLSFSPDGQRLAVPFHDRDANRKGIRCWNVNDWDKVVDYPMKHSVRGCVFSRDSKFIFCGSYEGYATVLNLESANAQFTIPQQRSRPNDIAVAGDDRSMAVAYDDGTVALTQLPSDWQQLKSPTVLTPQLLPVHDGGINAVQFIGSKRLVTCGNDGLIRISDVKEKDVKHSVSDERLYNRCKFLPNGKELIVATTHGIRRYGTSSHEAGNEIEFWGMTDHNQHDRRVISLSVTDSGDRVGVGNGEGGLVIYDLNRNRIVHRLEQDDVRASAIGDIAFSPDGKWMANGSRDHTVRIRSTADWREVHRIETDGWGTNVEYSPDGDLLAYSDSDGALVLLETQGWREVARCQARSGFYGDTLRFTPNGQNIVTGHKDSVIRVWETGQLKAIGKMKGHMKSVLGLSLSGDGATLASVGADCTIRLWSLTTFSQFGVLGKLDRPIFDCDFSPDGTRLAVAEATNEHSTCHIWDHLAIAKATVSP